MWGKRAYAWSMLLYCTNLYSWKGINQFIRWDQATLKYVQNSRPIPSMMSTACLPRSPNWSMTLARILLISLLTTGKIIREKNLLWRSSWSATVLPASWASSTGSTFNPTQLSNVQKKEAKQCGVKFWPPSGWKASCFWQNAFTGGSVSLPQRRISAKLLIKNPSDSLRLATLCDSW